MHKLSELAVFFVGVCATLGVFFLLLVLGYWYQDQVHRDRFYPRVTLDGVSVAGQRLEDVTLRYEALDHALRHASVEIYFDRQPFATISGDMLMAHTDGARVARQAFSLGRSGTTISNIKIKLQMLLRLKHFPFASSITYDRDALMDIFATLEQQYAIPAQNALFEIKDGRVTAFSREQNGQEVNTKEALVTLERTLRHTNPAILTQLLREPLRLEVVARVVKPTITLSQANNLGIEELIGYGSSDYSGSIPSRVHNIILASARLHGVLIPQGEEFSYNKTIGEVSSRTGYQPAYVILAGRTVLGDGGGVCQTSTTLFRAAIHSGLPITEWKAHAYRVRYYENDMKPGMDATVYAPSVDLKFRNDTPGAILIQTFVDKEKRTLRYEFWGKKDNRRIEISDITLGPSTPAPPARYEEDPTLKKGVIKQVDWAATGLKAWFDYRVTRGDEVIQQRRFVSNYRPWQAVYLVGTME
jgi:vancomycin resistance protein YoaR